MVSRPAATAFGATRPTRSGLRARCLGSEIDFTPQMLIGKIKKWFADAIPSESRSAWSEQFPGTVDDRSPERSEDRDDPRADVPEVPFRGLSHRTWLVTIDRLREFVAENPHPTPYATKWCRVNERDLDFQLGAAVCQHCRDRLAVVETLACGALAVRARRV